MPRTSSRLVEKTGIRLRPDVIARSSTAPTVEEASTATTSGRGRITSRTIVSPNSMIEEMRARSSLSSTSSATATSARARISDSVTSGSRSAALSPGVTRRESPMSRPDTSRTGGKRMTAVTNGAANSAARSAWRTAQCFGTASAATKITTTSKTVATGDAERTEQARGLHADERRRDELADQHQQEDRREEHLGVLDQTAERARPVAPLLLEGLGALPATSARARSRRARASTPRRAAR